MRFWGAALGGSLKCLFFFYFSDLKTPEHSLNTLKTRGAR